MGPLLCDHSVTRVYRKILGHGFHSAYCYLWVPGPSQDLQLGSQGKSGHLTLCFSYLAFLSCFLVEET